ncbi:MAG TPA: hypothetical protein VF008_25165 [Niastella sp.]
MANFKTGQHENFFWIEFPSNIFNLSDLLREYAGILTEKYLAVVCFDSGPLKLTAEEKSSGWHENKDIAYSPKLTDAIVATLFYEQYDQWCLFNVPTGFSQMTNFVNYGRFSLTSRKEELIDADPSWDLVGIAKQLEQHEQLLKQFWEELVAIDPFNFIADGDNFIFVSKDIQEIETLKKYCA